MTVNDVTLPRVAKQRPGRKPKKQEGKTVEMKVGSFIRERRLKIGMSQEELAAICGVSPSMISRIENGTVQPSFKIMALISQSLDFSLDDLGSNYQEPK